MSLWAAYDIPEGLSTGNVKTYGLQEKHDRANTSDDDFVSENVKLQKFFEKRGLGGILGSEVEVDDSNEFVSFEEGYEAAWNTLVMERSKKIPPKLPDIALESIQEVEEAPRPLPWLAPVLERQRSTSESQEKLQDKPKREKIVMQVGLDLRSQFQQSILPVGGPWALAGVESDESDSETKLAARENLYFLEKEVIAKIEDLDVADSSDPPQQPTQFGYSVLQDQD
jgi:hypothetical protein